MLRCVECFDHPIITDFSSQAAKTNGRSKEAQGRQGKANDPVADARNAAHVLVVNATQKVQDGMFCEGHNRLCYKTWDGKCRAYAPEHATEHSKLLVSLSTPPSSCC